MKQVSQMTNDELANAYHQNKAALQTTWGQIARPGMTSVDILDAMIARERYPVAREMQDALIREHEAIANEVTTRLSR